MNVINKHYFCKFSFNADYQKYKVIPIRIFELVLGSDIAINQLALYLKNSVNVMINL